MSQEIEQEKQNGFRLGCYIRKSIIEFKKVVWPKRPEAVRMTMFVMVFVAVFGTFIYGIDSLISLLFNFILVK